MTIRTLFPDRAPVALISAVPVESALLRRGLADAKQIAAPFPIRRGGLADRPVLVVTSGIGKINAAIVTSHLLQTCRPSLVISHGIGGAYPGSGLSAGDIALASEEILPDEGFMDGAGRFHPVEEISLPKNRESGLKSATRWKADGRLLRSAGRRLAENGWRVRSGPFLTVSTVTGTRLQALRLRRSHGAICENMEGAAVARACAVFDLPFMEIRGISNAVDNRDRSAWRIDEAAEAAQKAILQILRTLSGVIP